jgi:hypothetical protein
MCLKDHCNSKVLHRFNGLLFKLLTLSTCEMMILLPCKTEKAELIMYVPMEHTEYGFSVYSGFI